MRLQKTRKNSILRNKFIGLFTVVIFSMFASTIQALAAESDIKEYGIVILPEKKCTGEAAKLNAHIAKALPHLKNVENHRHVTLYYGGYETEDLSEICNKLKALRFTPFTLNFSKIYSTADRWIDLGTEKTKFLQNLHNSVVLLVSPYHKRPLDRSKDIYDSMTSAQRKQVDNYGVSGVLATYNPHMTLFYRYPPSSELQKVAIKLEDNFKTNMVCKASKIIIGRLGYNGNIEKIVYSINIPE